MQSFSLTYLNYFNIKNEEEGLLEPSGLVLSHSGNSLWTVSDDTKMVFKISLTGKLKKKKSFKTSDSDLEGITLVDEDKSLLLVKEGNNELIKMLIESQEVIDRNCLEQMTGYDAVAQFFSNGKLNKGLEGIAWNPNSRTIFAMKEGSPGLLLEVSSDLKSILNHQILNADNGFYDAEVNAEDMDFSDICYDNSRDKFWIISDMAKRLFLYDWRENTVIQSSKLSYAHEGEYFEIQKPEGIAINPDKNYLYIVSDESARLYLFDIRS